jgi:hypothetical protein
MKRTLERMTMKRSLRKRPKIPEPIFLSSRDVKYAISKARRTKL